MPPPADPTQATVTAALLRMQAARGWLSDQSVRELAADLGLPISRLEEVASFFPHFRRTRPPAVELRVCRDFACFHRGAKPLTDQLHNEFAGDNRIEVTPVSCLGRCDRPVAACLNRVAGGDHIHDALYVGRSADELAGVVRAAVAGGPVPPPDTDAALLPGRAAWEIDAVAKLPAFATTLPLADRLRRGDQAEAARISADLLARVKVSGLLGMGGGQEEAAKKWSDVAGRKTEVKYVVANGDESEPGTFKDRDLLLRHPRLVVEGVILAGAAVRATRGYIFIRHEYPEQIAAVRKAVGEAYDKGAAGDHFPVSVFVSPGGYICGEQSALIEAMEGNRAQPRNKPPTLATNGLFDMPTLVNNVETLSWVPGVIARTDPAGGPAGNWYGGPEATTHGRRLYSVCGDVVRPGVYELPRRSKFKALLEAAGGVIGGDDQFLAVAPSGPSGGFAPRGLFGRNNTSADLFDMTLEKDAFGKWGMLLGSGLMVYARGANLPAAAVNATEFYRNESCGKCVPCRVGSQKLVDIGRGLIQSKAKEAVVAASGLVGELDDILRQTSICSLGPSASQPLLTLLRSFPQTVVGG